MAEISRSPEELVAAAMGPHHQYPDGLALYLGTMFVPSKDRGEKGKGFTHKVGDIVTISSEKFGALVNRVRLSPDCPHWTYGASHLMRDLAKADLIEFWSSGFPAVSRRRLSRSRLPAKISSELMRSDGAH